MTARKIARFYEEVSVAREGASFSVLLDGKPVKTPRRAMLRLPNETLAHAVAAEWSAQTEHIDPAAMPLTGLASAMIDVVQRGRGEVIDHILGFGHSDLLCYRAESPEELVRRQAAAWDPWLNWLHEAYGIALQTGSGVSFIEQPVGAHREFERVVSALGDGELACLDKAAGLTGSLVVGLAMIKGRLDAREAFALAHIDENFQAEKWGRDAEAEARRMRMQIELEAVERFLALLRAGASPA